MSVFYFPLELDAFTDESYIDLTNERFIVVQSSADSALYYTTYEQIVDLFRIRRHVRTTQTFVNVTTATDVTQLTVPVAANTAYFLEYELAITLSSPSTNSLVLDISGPAGTLTGVVAWQNNPSVVGQINKAYLSATSGTDSVTMAMNTSTTVRVSAAFYPTAAGNVIPRLRLVSGTGTFDVQIRSVTINSF